MNSLTINDTMPTLCAACHKVAEPNNALNCHKCKCSYHMICVNISLQLSKTFSEKQKLTWLCPACKASQPRDNRADTPVRPQSHVQLTSEEKANITFSRGDNKNPSPILSSTPVTPTKDGGCPCISTESLRDMIRSEIRDAIRNCTEEIIQKNVTSQLRNIHDEISSFKESISFMNEKFEEMKTDYLVQKQNIETIIKDNESLRSAVQNLSTRLNQMDQLSRAANIEIQCVPEHNNENLITLVSQLGRIISCPINEADIAYCTRTAKYDSSSPRPRSILVRLSSPRIRDTIIAAVIKFNKAHPEDKLSTGHLGIGGNKSPIYVVENLSPEGKYLFGAARKKAKKELGYKFVWVINGRVYARKTENSPPVYIRDMDTISKLT